MPRVYTPECPVTQADSGSTAQWGRAGGVHLTGLDKENQKSLERVCREPGVPVPSRSTCQIWARLHLRADIWVARLFIGKDSVCLGLLGIRGQNKHLTEEPWISCCAGTRAVYL